MDQQGRPMAHPRLIDEGGPPGRENRSVKPDSELKILSHLVSIQEFRACSRSVPGVHQAFVLPRLKMAL